jgi:endoglucanase
MGTVVLVAALALLALPATAGAAPQLKVQGNHLVDTRGGGQTFVPRGVNWPSFEYACSDGYGYSNAASADKVGPDAAGAALIASWHINTVRIPLNQDCWLGDDGLPRFGKASGYRAAVKRWVSTLHDADLAVVLDLHWSGPAGVISDGQRAMPDDRSDDFWTSVARTFKKDRSVIFDVFNEPYSRYGDMGLVFDLTWDCWRNGGCNAPRAHILQPLNGNTYATIGMQAMVDAIRSTGATQPIVLSGRDFANDVSGWLAHRPADGQLIAGWHNYSHQPCHIQACWDATVAPVAAQVPVIVGEFGQDTCTSTHNEGFMDWADQRGIGYLIWAWWVLPDRRCSTHSVLADVKGRARAPNGTTFKKHMNRLAPRVKLGGAKTQALDDAIEVRVRCAKACRARVTGRLAGRSLQPAQREIPAGGTRTIAVELPRAARRAAAKALSQGEPVAARVTVVATADSLTTRRSRLVKLRRL